jgi:hypothetical protein
LDKQKERELKKKLEGSLYRGSKELSSEEWEYLKEEQVIEDYEHNPCETEKRRFEDFRGEAKVKLNRVHRLFGSPSRQRTEDETESKDPEEKSGERSDLPSFFQIDEHTYRRGEAVHSRGQAIHAYERLHKNKSDEEIRPLYGSTTFLGEGVAGGTPQWIILIHAQAWIPADLIKEHYQRLQNNLSHERGRKTQPRSFDVVRFVWETEIARGKRLSWPKLMNLWNERSSESAAFTRWHSFRKCFKDAEASVLPHYQHDDNRLREMIDNGSQVIAFDRWAEEFRRHL